MRGGGGGGGRETRAMHFTVAANSFEPSSNKSTKQNLPDHKS